MRLRNSAVVLKERQTGSVFPKTCPLPPRHTPVLLPLLEARDCWSHIAQCVFVCVCNISVQGFSILKTASLAAISFVFPIGPLYRDYLPHFTGGYDRVSVLQGSLLTPQDYSGQSSDKLCSPVGHSISLHHLQRKCQWSRAPQGFSELQNFMKGRKWQNAPSLGIPNVP